MIHSAAPKAEPPLSMHTGKVPTVCQVLHSLNIGGAEMLAARLARRLAGRFHFVFACLDELGTLGLELRHDGFVVKVCGRKPGFDLSCVRRLAGFIHEQRADVVHAHQYTPFFYCRAPGSLIKRPPVLFNEHGRFHPDLPNRKRMVFNRFFLRRSDRVVAVGGSVKQALVKNEGIKTTRIQVIYNGVRMSDFSGDAVSRHRVRTELGIGADDPVVIQVARLDYLKDHCTAVRAAKGVVRHSPKLKLLLVGEGPERPKIEAEVARLGLQNNVRLLGSRADVRQLLAAADLFFLTSISEGIPVTLIEAMMARLPIVSTNVGGIREVVVEGETGLLTAPGDDGALADAVVALINDRELRTRLGEQGRARAEERFSEEEMHDSYAALYEEMALAASIRRGRPA